MSVRSPDDRLPGMGGGLGGWQGEDCVSLSIFLFALSLTPLPGIQGRISKGHLSSAFLSSTSNPRVLTTTLGISPLPALHIPFISPSPLCLGFLSSRINQVPCFLNNLEWLSWASGESSPLLRLASVTLRDVAPHCLSRTLFPFVHLSPPSATRLQAPRRPHRSLYPTPQQRVPNPTP